LFPQPWEQTFPQHHRMHGGKVSLMGANFPPTPQEMVAKFLPSWEQTCFPQHHRMMLVAKFPSV